MSASGSADETGNTAFDSGAGGPCPQPVSGEFYRRAHSSGPLQAPVRPGAELLFLPGCRRGLPHRLLAGGDRREDAERVLLRDRIGSAVRRAVRTADLRLSVPFWLCAGPAAQNSLSQAQSAPAAGQNTALGKIRVSCRRAAASRAGEGLLRHWRPVFLQIRLPRRNTGGRPSPAGGQRGAAGRRRVSVLVEAGTFGAGHRGVGAAIPPVLQISLPLGGDLRTAEPLQRLSDGRERRRLHSLRTV
ncbi:hypothetical protein SDC9_167462 [bioreactor metagenome]|uniref:Uncharacterized protein n=1 Tax=bioreactor metagenome TaxID=1076179 RepID=A0A645G0B7_9ZZZZ